jgi:selenocysteine lyase/cysteine desulfurase
MAGPDDTPSARSPLAAPGVKRALFDIRDDVAYFNTANMSPLLRSVREAGKVGLERRARPWTISSRDWFDDVERLRERVATLIGADIEGVAMVPATSYGLAIAAANLEASPGDEVLVLADEFPSSFQTWRRFARRHDAHLVVVAREPGQSWTEATLAAITERTRVVCVPNVHWTNGALIDVVAVAAAARNAGAAVCVDASQSLGAMPLDLAQVRPDFVVTVGYKWLLGPFSVGYLYVAEAHRDGAPIEESWINYAGSDDFTALVDYAEEYLPGARRFDVGQRTNFGLVPMAIAAVDQLLEWGVENIAGALQEVNDDVARRLGALGLTLLRPEERGPHMLGVALPREAARRVATVLSERGVVASVRDTSLRLAPHLHVVPDDVDRLVDGLAAALR